ncbi:DUF2523 family protein [Stenotrophomonas bentonitica]|jgi:hypothetical protein|uniref:DUF2523 family protein n=1 Tax=Stenotrophomonas TaxID=40323 RepID=UPI00089DF42F|nr:DUF2523 family protein [Stenotrophomonas sp. LM091]AOX64120.1 hypothetical protein BIZ42_19120 [Stenotrophomonas sp. LM091]
MPLFIASLLSGLAAIFRSQIGTWIVTAMAWLGIAWATHEFAVQPWIDNMQSKIGGGAPGGQWGAVLIAYAGMMKFDQACTMIASAVVTKFGVNAARAVLVRRT